VQPDSEDGDDLEHPIPRLHAYDTVVAIDGGGAYIGMVIATPLDASPRSLQRFREKQAFYLESFFSEYGRREWGTPREGKMKIYVTLHPESSAEAFEMLKVFESEARGRSVDVVISTSKP
jgi:hypothetical protein